MKSIWREILMAVIMGMILPGILLNWTVESSGETEPESHLEETIPSEAVHPKVSIQMKLRSGGQVTAMDMDEYLVGVLLAEMPASFEEEAKKAQAVAARTFTRKASISGGKHGDGSVCDDSTCCQAYCPEETYLDRGGTQEAVDSAREAVESTSGLVLTYGGELIEATYFSCSGGRTEDAVAVWGSDVPYLRAVSSPGEEEAAHFTDEVYLTKKQFADRLGISSSGSPGSWIGTATYTAGGGIHTLVIKGKVYEGTYLRSALGLRSTSFSWKTDEEGITITTRGYGHRVGMSQYGADAMAASGSSYEEILAHYYTGTSLELTNDPA